MPVPFVGPSATLATRKADVQRSVNMHLVGMETPGKAPFFLQGIPGLVLRYSFGAAVRGGILVGKRAFVVAGATLYEIFADYTSVTRGTLLTSSGPVDMAYGLSQLVIVDGPYGYVLTLGSNAFSRITADGFYGSTRVAFINNRFIFTRPDSQQYEWTAIDNATSVDALDFASSESQPDNIVAHLVLQDQVMFLGELTTEFHFQTVSADLPFERASGETFSVGCAAAFSAQALDNGAYWIGKDKNGSGIVYMLDGRRPRRISTQAVEQSIQSSSDLSAARAFCLQRDGLTFYCITAPGLTQTWCYEVASGAWHERCDLDSFGQYEAHRGTSHLYAFGMHLLGSDDGKLYEMDADTFTNDGDVLVRERTSPHEAAPGRAYLFFKRFFLDATTGDAPQGVDPQVEYSWSHDSGATWSNPLIKSLGKVGERFARIYWPRLGIRARDLVHRIRFSGNARFDIIDAGADTEAGTN